jgi:hypothetical protein
MGTRRSRRVRNRYLSAVAVSLFATGCTPDAPPPSAAPPPKPVGDAVAGPEAGRWAPPRTSYGEPDLTGVWLSDSATPLQRPTAFAGRASLTDAEVAEFRHRFDRLFRSSLNSDFTVGDGVFQALIENPALYRNPNATGGSYLMADLVIDHRTSLITDPPDGRIPALTPAGEQRQAQAAAAFRNPRGPTDLGGPARCISWSVPRLGGRYGAGDMSYYEIFQSPGYVVLYFETGHEARVIPLDGRPHLGAMLRQWSGDSRARWEGDVLVVETTNFSASALFMGAAENLTLVERFARVAPDRIEYTMTLTDPETWERPWTAMMPLNRRDETLYEYACHEGNFEVMSSALRGARAVEAARRDER